MLTHTWILKEYLGRNDASEVEPDLFIHNVAPDILTIHQDIRSDMTHGVERFLPLPEEYRKANFVKFHLMVDDIAHHGRICQKATAEFNPASGGYAYRKGTALIEPIRDFHKSLGQAISHAEAAYCSHILIEMAFDQVLQEETDRELVSIFSAALSYTLEAKLDEFCQTSSWLYGIGAPVIAEALGQGREKYDVASEDCFASLSGRLALYIGKFKLDNDNAAVWSGLQSLLSQAIDIVDDYDEFLIGAMAQIRDSGFKTCL